MSLMLARPVAVGRLLALWLLWLVPLTGLCAEDVVVRAGELETRGQFHQANLVLTLALDKKDLSLEDRAQLEFELDRLRRIRLDFPYSQSELFADLKKSVAHLTQPEFDRWVKEGRFDSREIDGQLRFMVASVSNLFFRYPELESRRIPARNTAALETHHWETCAAIKKAARAAHQPYVLPKRFLVTMEVTAKANVAPDGETIRAWLPIPRLYPFQNNFNLISASPPPKHIDLPSSPARSVYLEAIAREGKPTQFKIQYEYATRGVFFDLKPEQTRPADLTDPALSPFIRESENVQFTPGLRALSDQITAGETNVCIKAKRFYDWISVNIKYSFAIEYSTIRNISEYCRSHGYGDCGQEGLLFITLCRLNGIPARWQSGWNIFPGGEPGVPGAKSNHDWTEIYLAPYGWVPVDPYMGIYATRLATSLTPQKREQLRGFYFGGLDQYRMAANSDHNQALTPPKQTMRSDNVDFQRGELEWGSHNIYFDQFSYQLTTKELPGAPAKVE